MPTFNNKDNKTKSNFQTISISLASPEDIMMRSCGEVLKPETVNYRTYKPERDGLFCEKIFGPTKDYECYCGKYKRIRYRGIVCDRCNVEVTEKKVRRERMGHISLTVPVAHIWYFKSAPNKISALLGLPAKKLESVIYYEKYIVVQPGAAEVDKMALLSEDEYLDILAKLPGNGNLPDSDPEKFIAKMGAEGIYDLLKEIDVDELGKELRQRMLVETSQQRKAEILKRLQVVKWFQESKGKNRPEWMIMKVIPVIPPDLRPLVPLDGGRFATSDLNDLYRRVIIRNNRLKRLIEIKAPEVILRNEKRMLQEAVDSLFDNSKKSSAVKSESNRALKSLSDSLKGKQGRFRQNLLGKRVDYSARSVIVVGPELNMHECGLPKFMAAELYKPFIIRKLIERGIVKTVKSAKKIVDRKDPVIWDILENVMKGHPVLLNRAPTLHRLGIQAFQPRMIEGKAIQLHPLACTAFNADFDGDQMAVHLPLGNAAIMEAQLLMLGSQNILNPANGAPITVPSQDMVLGLYYITKIRPGAKGENKCFYSPEEVIVAYDEKAIEMHAKIKVRLPLDKQDPSKGEHLVETTAGRIIVNQYVPDEVPYVNELLGKKALRKIITEVIKHTGVTRTAPHRQVPRRHQEPRLRPGVPRGHLIQPRRRDRAEREDHPRGGGLQAGGEHPRRLRQRFHHQQRALQQGDRPLVGSGQQAHQNRDPADLRRPAGIQPRVHDAGFRSPRFHHPDQAALRHARPDGQAPEGRSLGSRHHREPHRVQPEGRNDGARILHLHPRST